MGREVLVGSRDFVTIDENVARGWSSLLSKVNPRLSGSAIVQHNTDRWF